MASLRLLAAASATEGHGSEVFSCCYSADGQSLLSAGWDGQLRLWDSTTGDMQFALAVSPKPLSACSFTPDGRFWVAGSMEGFLTIVDPATQQTILQVMAHTRPISGIAYAPEIGQLATASWDRSLTLRKIGKERDCRTLWGHQDIVSGCRFTPDCKSLVSWSHDGSLRVWDVSSGLGLFHLTGHEDRILSASLSADGRWIASGGRDGMLKLWDLEANGGESIGVLQDNEIRACFFLLDAESLLTVDSTGRIFLLSIPDLELQAELNLGCEVLTGDLSPSGMQFALGCADGNVRFIAVDGVENRSLLVVATRLFKESTSMLGRFFGSKPRMVSAYQYTCPSCRRLAEVSALPGSPVVCPQCQRTLRISTRVRQLQES